MSGLKQKLKVILELHLCAYGTMHVINHVISSSAILKNILKPQTGNYYHWKMGDIFYRKTGTGTPLLLIHDLNPYSSGLEWNQIEERLKNDHTLYTIDLPGCGRSAKPGITYTNYLYVQMISDFIRDVIGEKTDVAATGLSSSFVIMAAYSDSTYIDRILMVNPVSLNKLGQIPDEKSKAIRTLMCWPVVGTSVYHMKACRQNLEYEMTENYFYNPFHIQQKLLDGYYEAAHYQKGQGKYLLASLDGNYLNVDIRKPLGKLQNKNGILFGNRLINEKEVVQSYQKINEEIISAAIPDTKLLPQLEAPDKVAAKMLEFF